MPNAAALTVWPSDSIAGASWGQRGVTGNPQDLNRYTYALNNPLKYTDPTGHMPALLAIPLITVTAPVWAAPVAIGLGVVAVAAGIAYVANEVMNDDGDYSTETNHSNEPSTDRASVDDLFADAKPVSPGQYVKPGTVDDANSDFDAITRGLPIVDRGSGRRSANLPDGRTVVVRPGSSRGNEASALPPKPEGRPTIDLHQPRPGRSPIIKKLRYD